MRKKKRKIEPTVAVECKCGHLVVPGKRCWYCQSLCETTRAPEPFRFPWSGEQVEPRPGQMDLIKPQLEMEIRV